LTVASSLASARKRLDEQKGNEPSSANKLYVRRAAAPKGLVQPSSTKASTA